MAKYTIEDTTLTNIANSIREKTGKSEKLLPSQMPNEIKSIEGDSGSNQNNVDIEFINDKTTSSSLYPNKAIFKKGKPYPSPPYDKFFVPGLFLETPGSYDGTKSGIFSYVEEITLSPDITILGDGCFTGLRNLKIINLDNIELIEKGAFANCSVLLLDEIPDKTVVEGNAFQNCKKITVNKLPTATTVLDEYTFDSCSAIPSFTINDNVNIESARFCFRNCTSLTNIKIPNDAVKIPSYFLSGANNLINVNFPDTLISIENYAFGDCNKLSLINLPNSLMSINSNAFKNCNQLGRVILPNSLTTIGTNAFQNCNSLEITEIPPLVTDIKGYVFENCKTITNINVLGDVKNFAYYCFRDSGLTTLSMPNVTAVPTGGNAMFQGTPIDKGTGSIYVPDALVENFKSATNWSNYADVIKPISEKEV